MFNDNKWLFFLKWSMYIKLWLGFYSNSCINLTERDKSLIAIICMVIVS